MKTMQHRLSRKMNFNRRALLAWCGPIWGCKTALSLLLLLGSAAMSHASTLVSGNISGTWNKAGSPYYAVDNCTVPSGLTLTIQPGVEVVIGENLGINVSGRIVAGGTCAEWVVIRGPTATNLWQSILLLPGSNGDSQFSYCRFSDAHKALLMQMLRVGSMSANESPTMTPSVANCEFRNCSEYCMYGDAEGYVYTAVQPFVYLYSPTLNPSIQNCRFSSSGNGLGFYISGALGYDPFGRAHYAQASSNPIAQNAIFETIAGTAFGCNAGSYAGSSAPNLLNSLMTQCSLGASMTDPFDGTIWNNIIQNGGIGVQRTGSLSSQVGFNCFYNNSSNFVGYPSSFGHIVMVNNNGTPCDIAFNIFQAPAFQPGTNYFSAPGSACVDAGDSSQQYSDVCFPPSLGSTANDIGPYGGPHACNWLCAPTIVLNPMGETSCIGQDASFSVLAVGAQPLNYQWYFNGGAMSGKTSTNLDLTNLQADTSGQYWVVVTNYLGSVTSTPAQLVVNDACVGICMYAGLTIAGQAGSTYVLKYTTDIGVTNFASWTPLATNVMPVGTNWFYLDMGSCTSPKRFYGVKLLP